MVGRLAIAVFALSIVVADPVSAMQGRKRAPSRSTELDEQIQKAKADVAQARENYKNTLEVGLVAQRAVVSGALVNLEARKVLFEQKLINGREVQEAEHALDIAKARVEDTLRRSAEAELFAKSAADQANDASRSKAPYGKDLLLRVLSLNALPLQEVQKAIERRGVSFHLTPEDEATFVSAGATRDLLKAIASNYRVH